jgi:hypothetical protein
MTTEYQVDAIEQISAWRWPGAWNRFKHATMVFWTASSGIEGELPIKSEGRSGVFQ